MVKTLRITTIIAAFLAVGLLAFPVVYGDWSDEEIEKFLKSPGAIEKFNKAKGAKVKSGNQVSPLVRQAVAFGLIINPPPPTPVQRQKTTQVVPKQPRDIPPPPKQSVKFKLIGTSYYASRPELSLAYIDEPGKGMYWVRQGANVGHLLIEEVKNGSIIVKDHEKTVTLAPERAPKKSLIKGETTSPSATTLPAVSTSITSSVTVAAEAGQSAVSVAEKTTTAPSVPIAPVGRRRLPQPNFAEQDAALADFINELKAKHAGAGTGQAYSEAEKAELKEAIATFEALRITAGEANRLDRLGRELNQDQRIPARTGGSKVGSSRIPQPPPRQPRTSQKPPTRRPVTRRPPSIPPK